MFPWDQLSRDIVCLCEQRNWSVPGLIITRDTYGSGNRKVHQVREIKHDDWNLYFCGVTGRIGKKYNNCSGLSSVTIPGHHMDVYEDWSGPSYYRYVGKNYETDKHEFMNGIRCNSRLKNKPKTYLKYTGADGKITPYGGTYRDDSKRMPKYLMHDNDMQREYSLEGDEPTQFGTHEIFNMFCEYLRETIIPHIQQYPRTLEIGKCDIGWEEPILRPFDQPLICFSKIDDWKQAERIMQGMKDPEKLDEEDRHASFGSKQRLVPLDIRGKYPKIANEGFIWADPNQSVETLEDLADWFPYSSDFGDPYLVYIKLKYMNDVYIADYDNWDATRKAMGPAVIKRGTGRYTSREVARGYIALGRSIIPIAEYEGNFKDPVILIERELDFDEIEWVKCIKTKRGQS
jgi:hypothetical protein